MALSNVSVASVVQEACARVDFDRTRMMDVLWHVQRQLRCVDREAMRLIAGHLGTYEVVVEGLVTFYAFFSTKPQGDIVIRLCDDIVDQHAGLDAVAGAFSDALGIAVGETRADRRFTLEYTPCIGMCDQAPGAMVNGTARSIAWFSGVMRLIQSGFLYHYAFAMVIGLAILLGWLILRF